MMNISNRLYATISKRSSERVPVLLKIWADLAARIVNVPIIDILNDPAFLMRTCIDAAQKINLDGGRLHLFPFRKVEKSGDEYFIVTGNGARIGTVDIKGGLGSILYDDAAFDLSNEEIVSTVTLWKCEKPPLQNKKDLACMVVPDANFYDAIGYGKTVDDIVRFTDRNLGLVGDCGSGTLTFVTPLRGLSQVLMDFYDAPGLLAGCMEKGIEIAINKARFFINHGIKILKYNESVANMSVISPEQWREFIFPCIKTFCDSVHAIDDEVKIYCHMCGNILPVINDLVETGLDCIAPLDPLGGYTVTQARSKVGNDVVLMGGINTLSFVESSCAGIIEEAKKCIAEGGQHGRFILGSGCAVPVNAKIDNMKAVCEASKWF